MADDSETINIRQFIKSLDPETPGQFEPLSGMMLINMPQSEFEAAFNRFAANAPSADDVATIRTINHETYHAMQTSLSGYGFDQQRRAFALFNAMEPLPDPAADPEIESLLATMRTEAGDDPELKRRADRAEAAVRSHRAIQMLEERAAPDDLSLFGALHPAFFHYQAEMAAHEAARSADGLSIQGLLEGSAVAYASILMYPRGDPKAKMEAELATLTPVYRELYAFTSAHAGARAMELMLPAVALSLCYSEPHNAYGEMLSIVAAGPAGEALAYGRKAMQALPALPAAGAVLGTSIELRHADDSYRMYDAFINAVGAGTWGADAYAVLADPDASNRLESFPFAVVTADNVQALKNSMDEGELVVRMAIMAFALRVAGRRKPEMEIEDLQAAWARDVLISLTDSLPPKAPE